MMTMIIDNGEDDDERHMASYFNSVADILRKVLLSRGSVQP